MDPLHLPPFYKDFPYDTVAYSLPNGSLCVIFAKGKRSALNIRDADFNDVQARLKMQDFDFMSVFPPFTEFSENESRRLARLDADRDMKSSRRLQLLTAAETHLAEMHADIQAMVDLNPWLDQQSEEQKRKLSRANELITELYAEVDMSREERFSDYSRQFAEIMAFEKGDLESVASEIEVEMETALEQMDARIASVEESLKSNPKSEAVERLGNTVAELTRGMKEASAKIKSLERGNSVQDLEDTLSEIKDIVKETSGKLATLEKEFEEVKSDVALSQEIKETVFRDSKRTYNLNERVTELERSISSLTKESGKSSKSEFKALEGKLNVMEKDLKDFVRTYVDSENAARQPQLVTSPPEYSVTPAGTIKKTTRTTTRKTTRSK